jgi:3-hydroxyacyl-[acyl-carrier-protein] dehydratase
MYELPMGVEKIKEILPHRYPFLMVDRVIELEQGKRAVAIKNVTANEGFFAGHYPERSIMPGVLILEALAQLAGIALMSDDPLTRSATPLLGGADNFRFRRPVVPGDQLRLEVDVIRKRKLLARAQVRALVDGCVVAEGELAFAFSLNE